MTSLEEAVKKNNTLEHVRYRPKIEEGVQFCIPLVLTMWAPSPLLIQMFSFVLKKAEDGELY